MLWFLANMHHSLHIHRNRKGFTLVEVAIVMAVIGMLVGGVLVGQTMLRQSAVQSVMKDFEKYKAAYYQFKEQYSGLPGDIDNATSYWGTDSVDGCTYGSATTRLPKRETCNGNLSNEISGASFVERFRAWQQLANAGLIEGTFSGVSGPGSSVDSMIGTNVPASKIPATGFTLEDLGTISGGANATYYDGEYRTVIEFGRELNANSRTYYGGITPREAFNIDSKMDDGKIAFGYLRGNKLISCTTSTTAASAEYNITLNNPVCGLIYSIDLTTS